jgi:RNA polymerase sigma factor (TIGR02999 family)
MPDQDGQITQLLRRWRDGSTQAENELFSLVNNDLRRLAQHFVKGERRGPALQATELVDQVYIRLVAAKDRDWQNRQHFFAVAARAMRRHLIDLARARPSAEAIPLEKLGACLPASSAKIDLGITVDRLLNELAKHRPEWCTLVELKYFLGLTDEEAAEVMGLKIRTMQRMWRDARQWLFEQTERSHAANNAN